MNKDERLGLLFLYLAVCGYFKTNNWRIVVERV